MPAFVQGAHNRLSSGSSLTATFGAAVTAGNTVIGMVCWGFGGPTITSVKDGAGNTFTLLDNVNDTVNSQEASSFYLPNSPGGSTTVVLTLSGTGGAISMTFAEYSGVQTASLDGHNKQYQPTPGTGSDGISSTAITTVTNGDIVIGIVAGTAGQAATFTGGTSPNAFTLRATTLDAGSPSFANVQIEDFIQSAAGSIAATFTQNAVGGTLCFVAGLQATVAVVVAGPSRMASISI